MNKTDLIEQFYTTNKSLKSSKVFKDENLYRYYVHAEDDRNSIYHYLTKVAEYDKFNKILYILDWNLVPDLLTTKKLLYNLLYSKVYEAVYKVEPVQTALINHYIYSAKYTFRSLANQRTFIDFILNKSYMPHFPKDNYLSPIRFNHTHPGFYYYVNKYMSFRKTDFSYYNNFLHIVKQKAYSILFNDYTITTGIRLLKDAKKFANILTTRINFTNLQRIDDKFMRIDGVKLLKEEYDAIEIEFSQIRANINPYCIS